MFFCILKTIGAWVLLILVGTNLTGLVVRGLYWKAPTVEAPTERAHEIILRESARMIFTNRIMTYGGIFVVAAYLFALFHFWNVGLAFAGGIVIVSRIPDCLREIRIGKKPNRKELPGGLVYFLASTVLWASLVLVWYSLCKES